METELLSFHDEHISDFSLSLDEQHALEDDCSDSIPDFEINYAVAKDHSGLIWGSEQELNGDIAMVPMSGVATVIPKIECFKEDFAKVFTDWQEHIGCLEASDMEEEMSNGSISIDLPSQTSSTQPPESLSDSSNSTDQNDESMTGDVGHINNIDFTTMRPIETLKIVGPPPSEEYILPDIEEEEDYINVDTIEEDEENSFEAIPVKTEPLEDNFVDEYINVVDFDEETRIDSSQCAGQPDCNVELYEKAIVKREAKSFIEETQTQTEVKKLDIDNVTKKQKVSVKSESVLEQPPVVLEANDVTSLLEQFEASEAATTKPSTAPKKLEGKPSTKYHQDIRNSLPKEVIDRIKASGRKTKPISIIPCTLQVKGTRGNATRMHNAGATLTRNKQLKIVSNTTKSSNRLDGAVQLDHDYCCSSSSIASVTDSNTECERQSSASDKTTPAKQESKANDCDYRSVLNKSVMRTKKSDGAKKPKSLTGKVSKKDSGLESGDVSDASEEQHSSIKEKKIQPEKPKLAKPLVIPIRSALATNIIQLQKGVLTKTKQMVSVLKKPLNVPQATGNPNESIVTTLNSSNDAVTNIIIQQPAEIVEEKQNPPKKKLNLAEYRNRLSRESRNHSPIQPMTLLYYHHASTTTHPVMDDPSNAIWSEREIISLLKPKSEIEQDKLKPKPVMQSFSSYVTERIIEQDRKNELEKERTKARQERRDNENRRRRSYRRRDSSSSSSRSRRRSRSSSSSSRSRSRSLDRRSRSRSRRRSVTRRRRISHRKSSVSSSSSWSSRSRSRSRSSSSSSSDSRSSRSRSRSVSYARSYSSCSRSWSGSDYQGSKWSNRRRRSRSRDKNYSRGNSSSRRECRSRSPHVYRRQYDGWFERQKRKEIEERRVVYVGLLDDSVSKVDLRRRFEAFGPVVDISLHFRERGDNYGFVTFSYKSDAYQAIEHGNDDPTLPRYDLCFGGRRAFCKVKYADLDKLDDDSSNEPGNIHKGDNTFDLLLKEAQAKLRKRKL